MRHVLTAVGLAVIVTVVGATGAAMRASGPTIRERGTGLLWTDATDVQAKQACRRAHDALCRWVPAPNGGQSDPTSIESSNYWNEGDPAHATRNVFFIWTLRFADRQGKAVEFVMTREADRPAFIVVRGDADPSAAARQLLAAFAAGGIPAASR